jgi:hypothetical protein
VSPRVKTQAEFEAACRKIIADMLAAGEAGRLDYVVFRALKKGLRDRGIAAGGENDGRS